MITEILKFYNLAIDSIEICIVQSNVSIYCSLLAMLKHKGLE